MKQEEKTLPEITLSPSSQAELRKQARTVFMDKGLATAWTALATKSELETALDSGEIPPRFNTSHEAPPKAAPANVDELKKQVGSILQDFSVLIDTNRKEVEDAFTKRGEVIKKKMMETLEVSTKTLKIVEEFKKLIKDEGITPSTVTVNIQIPDQPVYNAGTQHRLFPELIESLSLGFAVYLCGPAGSGKTEAAHQAAKALGLPFHCQSVCQSTSKSDLIGYYNPTGLVGEENNKKPVLVRTPFRDAYEHGGIYLLDEIDAGNPNVTLILNAALSNGGCSFPDGYITKHKDFKCIAAANTFGAGADRMYVGRNQIDAATLSRFAFIAWNYDEAFETYLSGDAAWAKHVQKIRKVVFRLKERIVVSPRASINGAKLIKAGKSYTDAEEMFIFGGVAKDLRKKIMDGLDAKADFTVEMETA